jgi:hypothetical protein
LRFELLDKIDIVDHTTTRRIALYEGDLSAIPVEHHVDILVVSAFPNDYQPTPSSLIGALQRNGLSVGELASDKLHDLRDTSAFWISQPIAGPALRLNIRQIACFEPKVVGSPPPGLVGDLFRGLFPFLDDRTNKVVALPLLATGDQGWPAEVMLRSILDAASHWLARGLGISELKIVTRRDRSDALLATMAEYRVKINRSQPNKSPSTAFDVFLSFSSSDAKAADSAKAALQRRSDAKRIFDYRLAIDKGKSWQEDIDRAITSSGSIIAILSPTYFASPECREELMQARLRNKRSSYPLLFPIYWLDWGRDLDLWLQVVNYADCREGNYQTLASTMAALPLIASKSAN